MELPGQVKSTWVHKGCRDGRICHASGHTLRIMSTEGVFSTRGRGACVHWNCDDVGKSEKCNVQFVSST